MSKVTERDIYAMHPILWNKAGQTGMEDMLSRRVRIRRWIRRRLGRT